MNTLVSEQPVMKSVKSILISQPKPTKSPYYALAKKHNIKIDFRQFIQVEGIHSKEFRKSKIQLLDFSAIIFTSRNAIKHFFRICEELKIKMPQTTKYFCASEAIALYLQKFTLYRKRKVFFGKSNSTKGLTSLLTKHKTKEKFLLPCSENRKADLPDFLQKNSFTHQEAPLYNTVASNLSDLKNIYYDIIVFFSPLGIKSLFHNFPDFKQSDTRIATFGPTTTRTAQEYGLRLDIQAPLPGSPSMTMAIEKYINIVNG